jgi:Arm DNA-binding domain
MKFSVKTTREHRLPAGKPDHIEFDDDIKGFGLRLREGGSRVWIYQYRIDSKQRRVVLGSATSVPLSVARKNAGELEARVKLGGDPATDKRLRDRAPTKRSVFWSISILQLPVEVATAQ